MALNELKTKNKDTCPWMVAFHEIISEIWNFSMMYLLLLKLSDEFRLYEINTNTLTFPYCANLIAPNFGDNISVKTGIQVFFRLVGPRNTTKE